MNKKVAFVCDSPVFTKGMKLRVFSKLPEVIPVYFDSGQDIIEDLKNGSNFDLVIIDFKLSDGNTGPHYTSEILELNPNTKVIGHSVNPSAEQKFLDNGAEYFLSKFEGTATVISCIKKILKIE